MESLSVNRFLEGLLNTGPLCTTKLQAMKFGIQRILESSRVSVGVILLILLAARAVRVWSLGIYWDDWTILIRGTQHGSFEVFRYLAGERILMGASHALLFAFFGPNPLAWHVANLCLEFGIAVIIYRLLRRLLPSYSLIPLLAACLFLAYPLSIIRTHMMNVFINTAILLAGVSLYLSSYPLGTASNTPRKTRGRAATTLAAALIPVYLLSYEMPVGFEIVRLYILWMIISGSLAPSASLGQRAAQVGKGYLPYAISLLIFALGRVVFWPRLAKALGADVREWFGLDSFVFPRLSTDSWDPGPYKVIHVFFHTLIAPWLNAAASLAKMRPDDWTWTLAWCLSLGSFALILVYGLYFGRAQQAEQPGSAEQINETRHWIRLLRSSLLATAALLAPILMYPSLTLDCVSYSSRNGHAATTVASLACLAFGGCLVSAVSSRAKLHLLTGMSALLIGLGVGYNSLLTNEWIKEWRATKSTWRQILNRVPSIKNGSLMILARPDEFKALNEPLRHQDVYEPAQLFYGIEFKNIMGSTLAHYWARRSQPPVSILPWLGAGEWQTKKSSRPIDPIGLLVDRQQILVLDECEGCLKVLDSKRQVQDVSSPLLNALSRFSNIGVIQPISKEGSYSLSPILLQEPNETWCDYYSQAGWLQQQKSWNELVDLFRQVNAKRLRPINPVEWLPFIEALDRTRQYTLANELVLVWVRSGSAHCKQAVKEMLTNIREEYVRSEWSTDEIDCQIGLLSNPDF